MRVVAVADLHGRLPEIPQCDVLVIAGDICPDFMNEGWQASLMRMRQRDWLRNDFMAWEQGIQAERILATPGNHDWIEAFTECNRSEMFIDELVEWKGKTFWFTPWSPASVGGRLTWNYHLPADQRRDRYNEMPYKVDLLVMHAPAYGLGDLAQGVNRAGDPELAAVIKQKQPRHAVFGHIHEGLLEGKSYRLGGSKLHHASMWGLNKPVEIEL